MKILNFTLKQIGELTVILITIFVVIALINYIQIDMDKDFINKYGCSSRDMDCCNSCKEQNYTFYNYETTCYSYLCSNRDHDCKCKDKDDRIIQIY